MIGRGKDYPLIFGVLGTGFASLSIQIVWTRQLGVAMGLETPAIVAVVAAWMGGLMLGSLASSGMLAGKRSPVVWFAFLNLLVSAWGIAVPSLLAAYGHQWLSGPGETEWAGISSLASFGTIFVAFLPVTASLGAALPLLERMWRSRESRCVGWVYGINTAGAVLGVLATAFWLIPQFGLLRTLLVTCCLSLGLAVGALVLRRRYAVTRGEPAGEGKKRSLPSCVMALALGFAGVLWQLSCVRILSQSLENSVYTYAVILAVYLIGHSLGALIYQALAKRSGQRVLFGFGLILAALAVALSMQLMVRVPVIYDALWQRMGGSQAGLMFVELTVSSLVLLLPATVMGGLLSRVLQSGTERFSGIGTLLFWSFFGALLAPLLFHSLLPSAGVRSFLILAILVYLGLTALVEFRYRLWGCLPVALSLWGTPNSTTLFGLEGDRSQWKLTEGRSAVLAVKTDEAGEKELLVNRRFLMGGTGAAVAERRQLHLPLLLHPRPSQALVLGIGTGITLGAVRHYPELKTDAVELLPELFELLPEFAPHNRFPWPAEKVAVQGRDARRFVRRGEGDYHVILADVYHPARDGAGLLYSLEHYRFVSGRLAPEGLFCHWLPVAQLDRETLRCVIRTFNAVFPESSGWLLNDNLASPVLGLIGSAEPLETFRSRSFDRPNGAALREEWKQCRLDTFERVWGSCFVDRRALERFAGQGRLNTDDNQYLGYRAPLIVAGDALRPTRILEELLALQNESGRVPLEGSGFESLPERTRSWLRAQPRYRSAQISLLRGDRDAAAAQLLQSLRQCADHAPSYAQGIALASQQAQVDPQFSETLLSDLRDVKPEEPLAGLLLERLRTTP